MEQADLVIGGYCSFGKQNKTCFLLPEIFTQKDIAKCIESYISHEILRAPWAKLFRRNIIERNQIRFDSRLRIGEDTVFVQTYLLYTKTIAIIEDSGYHYFVSSTECNYRLNEAEFLVFRQLIRNAYDALSTKYKFESKTYMTHYIYQFPLDTYYYYQCITMAYSFYGYKDFCRCIDEADMNYKYKYTTSIYGLVMLLMKRKEKLLSFLLLRFVRPALHDLKTGMQNL